MSRGSGLAPDLKYVSIFVKSIRSKGQVDIRSSSCFGPPTNPRFLQPLVTNWLVLVAVSLSVERIPSRTTSETMGLTDSDDGPFAKFQGAKYPVPEASTLLIHELIHDQAEAHHPIAEAVVSWDGTLSYEELDSASTRLAGFLIAEGVKPETIVPLLFEKSSWIVVGMLATMKAGGAFMTLDVSQPESRLRSIIAVSGAKVALSSAGCNGLCSSLVPSAFSVTEQTIAGLNMPVRHWPAGLRNAAYVMATSGSTGSPKLVVTEHSQLSSFVAHLTRPLGFTERTRTFQFASYAFDPIIGDIFLTLAAGGTVCIPSEDQRKSDIIGAMNSMRVNLVKFTPSLVNSLTDLTPANIPTLKTLILGGETTPTTVLQKWAGKVDIKLVYGSTECTISCVVPDAGTGTVVPGEIGRPFGSRAWVVKSSSDGSDLKLVTEGEVGELVLEGPLVARGYMNSPSESESKFIKRPAHRIYRTGDLVRRLDDGRLVYVGRIDNQVKIRGQRLELEEVEEHVRRSLTFPDIRIKNVLVDAAVPLGATSKQLVALLSLETNNPFGSLLCDDEKGGATVSLSPKTMHNFANLVSLLEAKMKSIVPSYMIPSLWVPIDEMPHTLSRKRDRQRLRRAIESLPAKWLAAFSQAHGGLPDDEETGSVVTTEKENLLRRLWSDVLGLDLGSIRLRDNFFHLGGNSLLVMRLISMARREGQILVADDVFAHPVLQSLAFKLNSAEESADLAPFALLEPSHRLSIKQEAAQQCGVNLDDIEDILPLSSMQEHYIFSYPELGRDSAGPWDWQQQIVFLLPEPFNIQLFKSVWNEAVKRHPQLRTRVVQTSYGVFQAALRNEAGPAWRDIDDLDHYVHRDREVIMSFGDELLRLAITKSIQRCYFVLTMQHLIYDAYSRDMLFKELEVAYLRQSSLEMEPPKMSKYISYINGADRRLGTEFWTSYLKGSSTKALLSAPISSPVGELITHTWTLEKPQLPFLNYTLATIIEASVALAIARILDCRDVIFYSDRAGRNLPIAGIQDLMAPATILLPLRVHIDRQQTTHDLLCAHQAANTAMMPYEYLEFTELRKMDHLKGMLRHSLNININPYTPLGKIGAGMGLMVVDEHERWGDPFTVDVSVREDELKCAIHFDESFISEAVVTNLVRNIKETFRLLSTVYKTPQMSVGDVLQS